MAVVAFDAGNAFSFLVFVILVAGNALLLCAFGTGEGLLWYGICVPCSKRPPGVRDAFSEAFGVKNRLLRYGRDIRCAEQPSLYGTDHSVLKRGKSAVFGLLFQSLYNLRDIRIGKIKPLATDSF